MAAMTYSVTCDFQITDFDFDLMLETMQKYSVSPREAVVDYSLYLNETSIEYHLIDFVLDDVVEELERRWINKYGNFKVWG